MAKLFAGLDVADRTTAICVIDTAGTIIFEGSTATEPGAIYDALRPYKRLLDKVGHETGTKATWLNKNLARRKLPVVCLDAWRTHAALAPNRNKTDKNDARGIAEVLCRGIFATSHIKTDTSQGLSILLYHRRALVRRLSDLQRLARSTSKMLGTESGEPKTRRHKKSTRDPIIARATAATQHVIDVLLEETEALDAVVRTAVEKDPVCCRLMTVPGVGPIAALTYRAAVDDPHRFSNSRQVGVHFGLTPRTFQSGLYIGSGHISKRGDTTVRSALYQSATVILNVCKSDFYLRTWGKELVKRKGFKIAAVAVARRLAVVMHQIWVTGADFDHERSVPRTRALGIERAHQSKH